MRQYFPGEDAVGKQITYLSNPPKPMEIVGIVEDLKEGPLDIATVPALYRPFNQSTDNYFALMVRTASGGPSLLPALVATIRQIDPGIITMGGVTMRDSISDSTLSAAVVGMAGGRLRRAGIAAGRGRTLRGGGLFGEPENSRNRRPHGAGRAARFGVPAHSAGGRVADCRGCRDRPGVLGGGGDSDTRPAVRRALLGCADAGRGRGRARHLRAAGQFYSRRAAPRRSIR